MTPTTVPEVDPLAALRAATVVAVLRAPSAVAGIRATAALIAGGVTGIEITYSTPDAAAVIPRSGPSSATASIWGPAPSSTPPRRRTRSRPGREFLVSPGTDPKLAAAMLDTGVTVLSGALTPSEVMATLACGVHRRQAVSRLARRAGPPQSLARPVPEVAFVPTGGVDADNLGDWLAAGAVAVGAGGDLCPPAAMAAGDWDTITATARRYTAAAQRAREQQR